MLGEPPPTQADLHFRIAGFPVRVHPLFWVIALLLGLQAFDGEPTGTLLAVAVVFVSILVHELGHAFLQRKFGGWPRIVLHGFGGLAICGDCDRSPRSQILISLAGPVAGFLLAGVVVLLLGLASGYLYFEPFWSDGRWVDALDADLSNRLIGLPLLGGTLWFPRFSSDAVNDVVFLLLWVNIFWGLMNLLPVYPLDGGQVAREVLTLRPGAAQQGIVWSLYLSIGVAVLAALFGLMAGHIFLAILFGFLGYNNWQTLQRYTGRGQGSGWR